MKALVVDDEAEYRRILVFLLKRRGIEVLEAGDGLRAWELFQTNQISLVLSDWMMPEMDGVELIQKIRQEDLPYYTYFIMLTARSAHEDLLKGLNAGVDDYLVKPFDSDEFVARLSIAERILKLEADLRAKSEQLEKLALYDSLTELLNRRALYEHADQEMKRAQRENKPLCVALFDLDGFKSINDRFGHAVGDECLRLIASLVNQYKRAYDLVGRWGGEEFLILLPGTNQEGAAQVAERLRHAIEQNPLILEDGQRVEVHASFGVACTLDSSQLTLEKLIHNADTALYWAKDLGRNQICVWKPGNEKNSFG